MRRTVLGLCVALPLVLAAPASAVEATVGPGGGAGQRRVPSSEPERAPAEAAPPAPSPAPPSHRAGPKPKSPSPTLPPGVPPGSAEADARHAVADGPTADELVAPPADPELLALREAERVLFPEAVEGITPGWVWPLPPEPAASAGGSVLPEGLRPPTASASDELAVPAWITRLALPDLPVRWDARVVKYLEYYRDTDGGRALARAFARKSGRFVPVIRDRLARAGLPRDLVWLSMIESGHNPTIKSPAGAAGLWQFISTTGRRYGLTVDAWVDERLDPLRATDAAILFLSDLHTRFGNWDLAMAAYNMGYGGLSRSITKYGTNDFWELCRHEAGIPLETSLYVPKILALAVVMNNKREFGIDDVVPDAGARLDTVRAPAQVTLADLAKRAGVSERAVSDLNPQLLKGTTPPGDAKSRYVVYLPLGTGESVAPLLVPGAASPPTTRVRHGETLASIAADHGVTEAAVRKATGLSDSAAPRPGELVVLPAGARRRERPATLPEGEREVIVVAASVTVPPGRRRVIYPVQSGDTVDGVAAALGVPADELVRDNRLDVTARLREGMFLQALVRADDPVADARVLEEGQVRLFVAGTDEFFDYHEGQKGKKRVRVTVRAGDTLAGIAERYGMSVPWMERVNRRSHRDPLTPGETVIVYAPAERAAPAASATGPAPLPPLETASSDER